MASVPTFTAPPHLGVQRRAARLSLSANVLLVAVKIAAGLMSGSVSVLAEGVQSLLDIVASAFILVTVKASAAPPDPDHPWGHGKFENLTALGQMLLVLGSIGGIWWAAWERWQHPMMPKVDVGIGALVFSAAVNFWVSTQVAKVARETRSTALQSEVVHLRGDLWSVGGVILGLALTALFREARLDPVCATLMSLFAAYSAVHLIRDTLRPLLDESLPLDEEEQIRAVLDADPRVLGYHRLRTRQAGSMRLADVHLLLADDLSFKEAHEISEDVEDAIRAVLPNLDVIVHAEPYEEEMRHQNEAHGEFSNLPPLRGKERD
jgi:cation diffusion facilitator family transporter